MMKKPKHFAAIAPWVLWLTISIIVTWLFVENIQTPKIDEDFSLSFGYGAKDVDLQTIYARLKMQYTIWNARFGEGLSIIWDLADENIYNTVNTAVTFLFFILIFFLGTRRLPGTSPIKDAVMLAGIVVMFLGGLKNPGEIFFWRTGSTNYLWSLTCLLLYILPVFMLFQGKDVFASVGEATRSRAFRFVTVLGYVLCGIIVGHANENTSPIAVGFLLFVVVSLVRSRRCTWWVFMALLSLTLGTLMLIFAHSTAHRFAFYSNLFGVQPMTAESFIKNVPHTALFWVSHAKIPLFILIFLILIYGCRLYSGRVWRDMGFCLLFSFGSAIMLAVAPYLHPRSFLLPFSLIVIATLHIFDQFNDRIVYATGILLLFFIALITPRVLTIHNEFMQRQHEANFRYEAVVSQLGGDGDIVIPAFKVKSKFAYVGFPHTKRLDEYFKLNGRKIVEY